MSVYDQLSSCWNLGVYGTVAKWVMIVGNLTQSMFGPLFVGMGFMIKLLESLLNRLPFVNVDWFSAPLIATGVFILFITLTGCLAAFKELKTLIALYSITMTLLVVGQVVLLCYGLYHVRERTEVWVNWAFHKPYLKQPFHAVEANLHCCGVTGARSYKDMGQPAPAWCCAKPVSDAERGSICDDDIYKGCAEVVPAYLQKLADKIGNKIYYVIGAQVIDVISSSVLFKAATPS